MEKVSQEITTINPSHARGSAVKAGTWRKRAHSHYQNILDLLRARGPLGVTSAELYSDASRFGRSPRNRVSELRADGHKIKTVFVSRDMVRYILQEGPRDWYEEQTCKPRAAVAKGSTTLDDLPLFAGVG